MKSTLLKKAWVIRWKNPTEKENDEIATINSPNCDRVEKATTFFKSLSATAERAPTINVLHPKTNINKPPISSFNRTHSPAVTKVEECTKAETGVGAAIAAGSHAENGN
jgi:hypothetical protein